MNDMATIDLSKIPVQEKVRAMCMAYPHMHSREIAQHVKTPTPNVSKIRSEMGLQRLPDGKSMIKHLSEANRDWLEVESEQTGVTILELLNAIVTDARNDD